MSDLLIIALLAGTANLLLTLYTIGYKKLGWFKPPPLLPGEIEQQELLSWRRETPTVSSDPNKRLSKWTKDSNGNWTRYYDPPQQKDWCVRVWGNAWIVYGRVGSGEGRLQSDFTLFFPRKIADNWLGANGYVLED